MLGWAAAEKVMSVAGMRMSHGPRGRALVSAALALGHVQWILPVLTRTPQADLFRLHPYVLSLTIFSAFGLLRSSRHAGGQRAVRRPESPRPT